MQKINVSFAKKSKKYSIFVGSGIIEKMDKMIDFGKYSSVYLIVDSNVARHHLSNFENILRSMLSNVNLFIFKIPSGEENKKPDMVVQIYRDMAKNQIDRKSLVLNLGGGVTSDLGGFVASTYMRGVGFVNIPTTLESMVDASLGGKTGVNLDNLKNYVGVISQPIGVISDINFLETLPKKALVQGYAEVIKHGLIYSSEYFDFISEKSPSSMSVDDLEKIISGSVKIKSEIVSSDENESGLRKILNFGHTVGHAIETDSMSGSSPLFHGEAVAIGMIAEAHISWSSGMIREEDFKKIKTVIQDYGLPVCYKSQGSLDDILMTIGKDKKNRGKKVKWTLLSKIGMAEFNVEISEKFAREALLYILD